MAYDFSPLAPADFEDLSVDLLSREFGVRFETFSAGPDGGVDGRHSRGPASLILQAKHYAGSPPAVLKAKLKQERATIDRLQAGRYLLTTSCRLSRASKDELQTIIGPLLRDTSDVFGPRELNALLRKHPDVEKSHVKLWLSGAPMLERIVQSASHAFTAITNEEIAAKIKVFAPNPSFDQALSRLAANNVLIVSGPPGVGKTTLAEMVTFAFLAEGWELVAIRSLEDGFSRLNDRVKRIFLFDDFLGKVALDHKALAHTDSELAKFIKQVRRSPRAKFILTTRAYIFEEARRVSEHLADESLDVSKYVLDVGIYTRRIKARILYNHLLIAGTPQPHIVALVESKALGNIVDHKNYNPRVIEWMTDSFKISGITASEYPAAFLNGLANPERLWDIAFRTHISPACRHLLIALFFCSEYGEETARLRTTFDRLHARLSEKHGLSTGPKDFEEAIKVLEGGFIAIRAHQIGFINPSLRDYLEEYLRDFPILLECARSASRSDWAQTVWIHGKRLALSSAEFERFAGAFADVAKDFYTLPTWLRQKATAGWMLSAIELSYSDRIGVLLEWFEHTENQLFVDMAMRIATNPPDGFDTWRDGRDAPYVLARLNDGSYSPLSTEQRNHLADLVQKAIITMIQTPMPLEELERIADEIEGNQFDAPGLQQALDEAIWNQVRDVDQFIESIDSESALADHAKSLRKLAERIGIADEDLGVALAAVDSQMENMAEASARYSQSSPDLRTPRAPEAFGDDELFGLFNSLLDP